MDNQKQNGSIIAIITMMFLYAMISFVTNLAAPIGVIWKNAFQGDSANTIGMLGNAMNVCYRDPGYSSLGFSTAMFGMVGLLCADIVVRSPAHMQGFRRLALPVAAALAFLAMLGAEGKNVDYSAHIFGLLSGFLIGLAVSFALRHHNALPRPLEFALGCTAPLVLLLCWDLAL